jgi:hypothetical protein
MRLSLRLAAFAALCACAAQSQVQLVPLPDNAGVLTQANLTALNANLTALSQPFGNAAATFLVTSPPYNALPSPADAGAAMVAAAKACNAAGGGSIAVPAGLWIVETLPAYNNCYYVLANGTELQLRAGSNVDMIQGTLAGYSGGVLTNTYTASAGSSTGNYNTGVICLGRCILDGNQGTMSGATPSIGFHAYGTALTVSGDPIEIRNFYGDCMYVDFSGTPPANATNGTFSDIFSHYNLHNCGNANGTITFPGAVGLRLGGPTDVRSYGRESTNNACESLYVGRYASAFQDFDFHDWGPHTGETCPVALIEGASYQFGNGEVEGSDVAEIALNASDAAFNGGLIFNVPGQSPTAAGFALGQAGGEASWPNSYYQTTPGNAASVAGAATAVGAQGYRTNTRLYNLASTTNGVYEFRNQQYGVDTDQVDCSYTGTCVLATGNIDNYANTSVFRSTLFGLSATGSCVGVVVECVRPTQAIASSGNIYLSTNAIYNQTALVTPVANVTGVTVSSGYPQGHVTIINNSAYSVTFGGTSHVATSVTGIAANSKVYLSWDAATSLWY